MAYNKKIFIYIGIALILILGIATSTVFFLKSLSKNSNTTTVQSVTKETADALKLNAITGDPAQAKTLLEQALKQYQELNDTHNISDVQAQLKILEYQTTHK